MVIGCYFGITKGLFSSPIRDVSSIYEGSNLQKQSIVISIFRS